MNIEKPFYFGLLGHFFFLFSLQVRFCTKFVGNYQEEVLGPILYMTQDAYGGTRPQKMCSSLFG